MLQPVLTIEMTSDILSAGKDDERWVVNSKIINAGQVPARAVRGCSFWDSDRKLRSLERDYERESVILAPGGGTIGFSKTISKAEAVAILANRELYFHTIAEYFDAGDNKYISYTTYKCEYSEGKFLVLNPIESNIVFGQ